MRTHALLLTVLVAFLFLNCNSLPPDPATLPENASIKVIAIDVDSQFKQPVKVSEETSIKVTLKLSLPDFIDSISLDIQSTEGEVEYHTSIEKPWDSTTFAVTLQFPSSGTKSLVYTAWISNGMEKTETVIFDVAARFTNASPVLAPKTIELLSEKGVPTTRNLMPYVTDPDNDKITFEIKGQGSVLPFVLKDSLLSSTSELEVGNYVLSIKVSDGILSDAGTILWKVYTPPSGSSDITEDIGETIKNIPVLINVLENDNLPSGSLLSYVSQGKNGKTIIADGKISYTPNSGFTGEDTLLYLVNGEDTGWVYVTVTEPEIENRPPAWAPDTVELYSPEGVVTSINVSPYASDPDNDALTFDVTVPADADFEVNNSVIASMAEMGAGAYYLLVAVSDGEETIAGMIKWTVFEVKDVEISPVDDSAVLEEGGSVVVSVLDNDEGASDAEGILITSVTQGTHGSATISGGTSLLYTPERGFSGTDTVMYVVNGSDTGRVIVSVIDTDPNTTPQWSTASTEKSSITGIAGSLNLESYASDADNDALTYSIASAPEAGFSLQEGTQLSVDAEVAEGEYTIVVTVSDGKASADLTVVWTVFPPAEAELGINDDEAEVMAGNSVTVNVLANDEVVSGQAQLVVTATTNPSHGSVSITDEGIVYSSDVNFQGDDSFLYIVNGTDTGTVTVKVGSAEVTVVEDQHSLSENGSITVNVLENDVAPEGMMLKVESVIQGTLGSAIVVDDSTVGYEANTDATGIDTVRYVLSTGDTGLVVLTIAAIEYNLTDDATSVLQGRTREIMVLANDAVNVGALTVTGVTDASKGSVSFTDSSVLYTAAADADGSDVLTYSVNNGKASAKLTVTFLAIEITAYDDSLTIDEDAEAQTVAVLENDAITEGETMTLTTVSQAQLGTVAIDETNKKVVYTPAEDSSGTEIVTYTINDAIDGTLKIVINPVNDVPEFTTTADNPTVAEGTKDTIIFSAIDADGTPVAFSLDGAPGWVTTSGGTNSIEIIFAPGYSVASADDPTATFTLLGVSGEDTLSRDIGVTVTDVNTAPVFTSPVAAIDIDEGTSASETFMATDAETDNLSYGISGTVPSWITIDSANSVVITATPGYAVATISSPEVEENIVITVSDGSESTTHTVRVTASHVNRTPTFTSPQTSITVAENGSEIVQFTATDPDGEPVSLSLIETTKPSWVTSSGQVGTISLTLNPDYTTVTSGSSLQYQAQVRATDGDKSVTHTLLITVTNVNRTPGFVNFPNASLSCRMGATLQTVALSGSDPDGDNVSFSLRSDISGMSIGTDNRITWTVPRVGYIPGKSDTVTVRVSDGTAYSDKSFIVQILPHQWKLVNDGYSATGFGITGKMTASGSNTLFHTYTGSNPKVYRSANGSSTWSLYVDYNGDLSSYGGFNQFFSYDKTIYAAGLSSGGSSPSCYYSSFTASSATYSLTKLPGAPNSFSVSPDQSKIMYQYDSVAVNNNYRIMPCLYFKNGSITRRKYPLNDTIDFLACGDNYAWAAAKGAGSSGKLKFIWLLKGYSSFSTTDDSLGFDYFNPTINEITGLTIGNENGDTAYAITEGSASVILCRSSAYTTTRNISSYPTGICMLTGSLGWIWDTNGDVYFTNDAFSNTTKETLTNDLGENADIVGIFKSDDDNTVYAFTRDDNNVVKIFRY